MGAVVDCFPERIILEDIPVDRFQSLENFTQRIIYEIKKPEQSIIHYLNIHGCNLAEKNREYKRVLQTGDVVFCDGAGLILAARLLGQNLPVRLTVMDWIFDMIKALSDANLSIFFLAGEPGVAERALNVFSSRIPSHTIKTVHHGYIMENKELERRVIEQINELKPDILFVGLGMPLQEFWIERNRNRLMNVRAICSIGAALDYVAGKIPKAPVWMGNSGTEWLFRLASEPRRLFHRYIVGNPWFLSRILKAAIKRHIR